MIFVPNGEWWKGCGVPYELAVIIYCTSGDAERTALAIAGGVAVAVRAMERFKDDEILQVRFPCDRANRVRSPAINRWT